MAKIEVEVLFPMLWDIDHGDEDKYLFEEKYKLIGELKQLCSRTQFNLDNYLETPFNVTIEDKLTDEYYMHFLDHGFIGRLLAIFKHLYLKFAFTADLDYNKVKPYEASGHNVHLAISSAVNEKVFQLLIVSQIAKPGSLNLRTGVILINGEKCEDIYGTPTLREAYSFSNQLKYPLITFLSLQEVYKWFIEKELLLQYEPKSKMQIALNAFTYLFDKHKSTEIKLVYTLMALEAIYTKGNNNITEQLNEKVQVYLGPMLTYKDILKKMYAIRSRYLHGDLPIGPIDHINMDIYPKFKSEILDAYFLSIMILIATFQKMFIDNRTSLNFEYKLK